MNSDQHKSVRLQMKVDLPNPLPLSDENMKPLWLHFLTINKRCCKPVAQNLHVKNWVITNFVLCLALDLICTLCQIPSYWRLVWTPCAVVRRWMKRYTFHVAVKAHPMASSESTPFKGNSCSKARLPRLCGQSQQNTNKIPTL